MEAIMQAIILAAGMGKRLKELTRNNTKCMVRVNGVTLVDRMLHQIEKFGLDRIVMVVGYESEKLIEYINTLNIQTPIIFINNPIFDRTNNIYSLALAKEWLVKEDTLLFESDLIFEDSILEALISDPRDTLALVDKYESWMDGTCVKIDDNDNIEAFVPGKKFKFDEIKDYYKTVNIYKFGKEFSKNYYVPFLEAYQKALGENEYYEQVLRVITMLDEPVIKAKRLNGQRWYEIDDLQDLDIAEAIFTPDEDERVRLLQGRYGGYWRFPKLLDFCYLVNPYFPPEKMKDELRANFDTLLTEYPSGMRVNSLLAAKNFGIHPDNIIIGNGAAELIKSLMSCFEGKVGIIRPTFEEYSHRYKEEDIVAFWPDNDDYNYSSKDIISHFSERPVDNLVVINPDNPSGNYLSFNELMELIRWTKEKGINLVIDESFSDFADEADNTLFKQDIIDENRHLFVMKSISKSFGVPGLRLGVLASGNTEFVNDMKKDVAIWNINSFAEFYMQIEEKYKKDYVTALARFREERARYISELQKIKGLRIIPTQANYVMAEILTGMTAEELTRLLIIDHNILIKNLSPKMDINNRQYIRLAVRNMEDNNALIKALHTMLD